MEEFKVSQLPMPFNCILPDCKESLSNSTIISHYCSSHRVDFQEIALNEKILMAVSTEDNFLSYGRNVCLGIVGTHVENPLAGSNTSSGYEIEHYPSPFPVLIMATKNNYQRIFSSGDQELDRDADFIALWLFMPKVRDYKLHSIMTVYDEDYESSISKYVDVKYITNNENILEVIQNGTNHLIVNSGMLKKLSNDDSIILEINLSENFL